MHLHALSNNTHYTAPPPLSVVALINDENRGQRSEVRYMHSLERGYIDVHLLSMTQRNLPLLGPETQRHTHTVEYFCIYMCIHEKSARYTLVL